MEMVALGVFSKNDKNRLEEVLTESIKIYWDYKKYNIECEIGLNLLKNIYGLYDIAVIVGNDWKDYNYFASYPLIHEIAEQFFNNKQNPRLFEYYDNIINSDINKLIIAYADEWDEKTLVRDKRINFNKLKDIVNKPNTWCEKYLNLKTNVYEMREYHPLILEVDRNFTEGEKYRSWRKSD